MKKEIREVFITEDNKVFLDKEDAQKHENLLNRTQFFVVHYEPDLNETGKPTKTGFLEVSARGSHKMRAEHWCFENLGSSTAFIQGISPTTNWSIQKTTKDEVDFKKIIGNVIS